METVYLCIVVFLLCLAVFDLFVGVSNDAVNFPQSSVGVKVANYRTIVIIASIGVFLGAVMSSGMMDVARHGIMTPSQYSFEEVMTIFLAVMVTDVIILDVFNTLGMPTSTTVSLVFELLGGTFVIACIKMFGDGALMFSDLMNTEQALKVIIAIFVSVAIAFVFGVIVMWLSRLVFTFNYRKHSRYSIGIFGGIAFTALSYFIFMKGLGKSPYISAEVREYIDANTKFLLLAIFVVSTILMQILHFCKVNIFKLVVLLGTFALAMAFAGNDLVNFIGVPLAGLSCYQDFTANANGASDTTFMMTSLMESAKTTPIWLLGAGVIMIIAMATSKKAQNVIKTSVDLSRQDEGDEMFGSSRAARAIVRFSQNMNGSISSVVPAGVSDWVDSRFSKKEADPKDQELAFDVVRAAVNLVLASMLITIGTNLKLPLSTTYVTFMVAMGSSLADRAWGRESAVFRVTGVLSVIGGWFITAGAAFIVSAVVCLAMFYGGIVIKVAFMALVIYLLIRSNQAYKKKMSSENTDNIFQLMMRTRDPELVWDMLQRQVSRTQSYVCKFSLEQFNLIVDGFQNENLKDLRRSARELKQETNELKKFRRQEMLGLKKCPPEVAVERNTWFHLGANSNQQFVYALRRMLEPIKEHIGNSFNPVPQEFVDEFEPIQRKINELMKLTENFISTNRFESYRDVLADADQLKDELSVLRKQHLDRMQKANGNADFQVSLVYLNLLQESQQFLSAMRHQLRAAKKFAE
ncbi:inorganic phosphate transporter [Prevotella sp. HUN102]|uniref:inorganic phosphate transporter n=1 Tax=Prevotella sp. HUN102 TaxID=1392486 RepID=UPI0004900E3A|nr:inorganic phosphate transporter [Prevotella sp. HUN102]